MKLVILAALLILTVSCGNIYKDNKAAKAEYARVDDLIKEGGHITVSKGSGKYVGLSVVEACGTCEGTGFITS